MATPLYRERIAERDRGTCRRRGDDSHHQLVASGPFAPLVPRGAAVNGRADRSRCLHWGGQTMRRISWWSDLTARRRNCAPVPGGCQRSVAFSSTPSAQPRACSHDCSPFALTLRPSATASASALWQRGHSGRTVRRHDCGVAGFAIECGQGEVHGGCAATDGPERHKRHPSLRQPEV